jgi:hypothetical protein
VWRDPVGDQRRGLTGLTAALLAAAVLAGGCAELPTEGAPQPAPARPALGGGNGGCCGLIVRGPQPNWGPDQVVSGFLLASAKPGNDFALARQYLEPGHTRNSWRPGSAVTILAQSPQVSQPPSRLSNAGGATVEVTGQEMATLKGTQYIPAASGDQSAAEQAFAVTRVNGQTLISQLPATAAGLLLTDNLFHLIYRARDVFYNGLRSSRLVPHPVFVPTYSNLVKTLVNTLLHNPAGELRYALSTNFPPGASFGPVEAAQGRTAIVNLHLPRGTGPAGYPAMAKQLVATLTSAAYGPPLFQGVTLKINGKVWKPPHSGQVLTLAYAGLDVPHPGGNGSVYYVDPEGAVRTLSRLAPSGVPVPGEAGTGHVPLSSVAVSPDGRYLAGLGKPTGTIYTATLKPGSQPAGHAQAGQLHHRLGTANFTGLSWDNEDDLWLTGWVDHVPGVWVLPNGRGSPVLVNLPPGVGRVTSIRVAPDGGRVAMLVGSGTKAHMEFGYIVSNGPHGLSVTHLLPLGPGLFDVTAIAWFNEDELVASAKQVPSGTEQGAAEQPQLWEVPADGDTATALHSTEQVVTSITAAGPQSPLYLISAGRLLKSVGLGEPWTLVTAGQAADYPG